MKTPEAIKAEFSERCTACGLCAVMCPAFAHRSAIDTYQQVQDRIRAFLVNGQPADAVIERSRLCNECWKCVRGTCPQKLDPMRTNQLLRGLLHEQGVDPRPFVPPSDQQSCERIAAALLTSEEEYKRITTPVIKPVGSVLFFPGCNIYFQPNLLLTAMDILDLIVGDWSFLPGLDTCCGSNHDSAGRLSKGSYELERLALAMKDIGSETLVTWCSTCVLRLEYYGFGIPVISFARLVADRIDPHIVKKSGCGGVTIQEPCKDAFMDMDPAAPRQLLEFVTGDPVREMARHGKETVCCNWVLYQHRPKAWTEEYHRRLAEASETKARILATVCHGCQWVMDKPRSTGDVKIINYVSLLGESLGIHHPERFRELRETGNLKSAVELLRGRLGDRFDRLPFEHDRIMVTIENLIDGFYAT